LKNTNAACHAARIPSDFGEQTVQRALVGTRQLAEEGWACRPLNGSWRGLDGPVWACGVVVCPEGVWGVQAA